MQFAEIQDKMGKEIMGEERPGKGRGEKWRKRQAATSCGI